jgi:uncharacterized membrane protein
MLEQLPNWALAAIHAAPAAPTPVAPNQWPDFALMILKIVHTSSGALLAGSVFFNLLIMLPPLRKLPVTEQVIVNVGVGTRMTYLAWATLSVQIVTGILRLWGMDKIGQLLTADFWLGSYGRWLAVMIFCWLVVVGNQIVMTFVLRPLLTSRLGTNPPPTTSMMQTRRSSQTAASGIIDQLHLVNVIAAGLAVIAGSSLMFGGII